MSSIFNIIDVDPEGNPVTNDTPRPVSGTTAGASSTNIGLQGHSGSSPKRSGRERLPNKPQPQQHPSITRKRRGSLAERSSKKSQPEQPASSVGHTSTSSSIGKAQSPSGPVPVPPEQLEAHRIKVQEAQDAYIECLCDEAPNAKKSTGLKKKSDAKKAYGELLKEYIRLLTEHSDDAARTALRDAEYDMVELARLNPVFDAKNAVLVEKKLSKLQNSTTKAGDSNVRNNSRIRRLNTAVGALKELHELQVKKGTNTGEISDEDIWKAKDKYNNAIIVVENALKGGPVSGRQGGKSNGQPDNGEGTSRQGERKEEGKGNGNGNGKRVHPGDN